MSGRLREKHVHSVDGAFLLGLLGACHLCEVLFEVFTHMDLLGGQVY